MDVEQKYIEEPNFEIDEDLIEKMSQWGFLQYSIPAEIFFNFEKVDEKNGFTQTYAGVAPNAENDPVHFKFEILRQTEDIPILVDINIIDTDDYLDYIILNKSITHDRGRDRI